MKSFAVWLVTLLVLASGIPEASGADRVALVIGNSRYKSAPLPNPENDAGDMAVVLKQLGFEVILKKDADQRTMQSALRSFSKKLSSAEIGLFYYAGHGMQIDGKNYLIPINNSIKEEWEVESGAVAADRFLAAMEAAGNPMNIVVLDACRDNPFKKSFRTSQKGLARMDAPPGTLIAYATSAGAVAEDGKGRNGTFTSFLLKNIRNPKLPVKEVFNQTGMDVMAATNNAQVPWMSSTPFKKYFLASDSDITVVDTSEPEPVPVEKKVLRLFVRTDPLDSRVRILNIKPVFYNGMRLEKGRYHIEVSRSGYETRTQWIDIEDMRDTELFVKLEKKRQVATRKVLRAGDTWTEPVSGIQFIWVPEGCFQMGSRYGQYSRTPRKKCLKGFFMAKYKVTQEQWERVMTGGTPKFRSRVHSVVNVTQKDARAFIRKLNQLTGRTFVFPTQAQWEYAAQNSPRYRTKNPQSRSASKFGLYDMSDGLDEWCKDSAYSEKKYPVNNRYNPGPAPDRRPDPGFSNGRRQNPPKKQPPGNKHYSNGPSQSEQYLGFRVVWKK